MNLAVDGFEIQHDFLDAFAIQKIIADIEKPDGTCPKHGIRNADKKFFAVRELVSSKRVMDTAQQFLSGKPQLVRVIIFDKTPDKNWLVSWHQDKTIVVNNKAPIDAWGPWTIKDGSHHVQPEGSVLEHMITLRIHLDAADGNNGCLKVLPKTHLSGILKQSEINNLVKTNEPVSCIANAGDMLVMRPLLLHSSGKGRASVKESAPAREADLTKETAAHRRVIHIEYCDYPLPKGLHWVSST